MKLKKCMAVIMGVCVLSLGLLAGCGSDGDEAANDGGQSKQDEGADAAQGGGYVFEANGVKIAMDADMAPLADALGEPSSYFEEPSCAAQGIAKLYTYPGFEVETYPDGDKDLVGCVVLKDDTVATLEGVDLSMTRDKVLEVYGDSGQEAEGSIVYEKGGMKLKFILDGDNIAAIEYNSAVME